MSNILDFVLTGIPELEADLIEGVEANAVIKIPIWKIEMVSVNISFNKLHYSLKYISEQAVESTSTAER